MPMLHFQAGISSSLWFMVVDDLACQSLSLWKTPRCDNLVIVFLASWWLMLADLHGCYNLRIENSSSCCLRVSQSTSHDCIGWNWPLKCVESSMENQRCIICTETYRKLFSTMILVTKWQSIPASVSTFRTRPSSTFNTVHPLLFYLHTRYVQIQRFGQRYSCFGQGFPSGHYLSSKKTHNISVIGDHRCHKVFSMAARVFLNLLAEYPKFMFSQKTPKACFLWGSRNLTVHTCICFRKGAKPSILGSYEFPLNGLPHCWTSDAGDQSSHARSVWVVLNWPITKSIEKKTDYIY